MKTQLEWPAEGITRTPYRLMSDPEIYAQEQERIFRGPVWHYLCLDAEIAEHGSFRTTYIGDTPIIATRDKDGSIHALVNRCAHKGALLCVEPGGQRKNLTCLYHGWTYDLKGKLCGVPFQHGVAGKGGMPEDFDPGQHGLERLRVEIFRGLVFGTFSAATEPLETYLGPGMLAHLRRVFHKPVEVLGYHHQVLQNNWKLYMENSRDPYHASILHAFYATFKLNRLTMDGGLTLDHDGWHNIIYSKGATHREGEYERHPVCGGGCGTSRPLADRETAGVRRRDHRSHPIYLSHVRSPADLQHAGAAPDRSAGAGPRRNCIGRSSDTRTTIQRSAPCG